MQHLSAETYPSDKCIFNVFPLQQAVNSFSRNLIFPCHEELSESSLAAKTAFSLDLMPSQGSNIYTP